ncbi:flagellar biosynthesis protein FlhB [Actibacterium mucosum KCTC 23349]|uniref:Flagellar biosynthesis protein FlhB n=1 Tax=Actibacterium mucosum KCTC 23349 TaxID=1454373 RepID=A0A037ZMM1_9RHOB|nr:flagellar type III secretion system protein FlhB [Actibacterium mucosum]KAJ57339.1 flagellar biosynthesis protein FlhB [Actibacterium mucosum KCTC 23349]
MSDGQEDDDKQHEPTQKKLDDARRRGELARSQDLNVAASYGGLCLAAFGVGVGSLSAFGDTTAKLLDQADSLSAIALAPGGGTLLLGLLGTALVALLPWFLGPAFLAFLSILGQRSLVFSASKLKPKLSRISPISNAKNKFGRGGLFEFAKSAVKLAAYCIVLSVFLFGRMPAMLDTLHLSPGMGTAVMLRMAVDFLVVAAILALVIGAIDYVWQYFEHLRKNRMSTKELRDEVKQSEGDPYLKQQRRQKGMAIAANRMLADVASADVVIVNPTHFAVALKWDRDSESAPVCVAKGVDEIAARIRETAAEAGVPLHSDPPTARAIHATVEIGHQIHREHYKAVAAAIRFAESLRQKTKTR